MWANRTWASGTWAVRTWTVLSEAGGDDLAFKVKNPPVGAFAQFEAGDILRAKWWNTDNELLDTWFEVKTVGTSVAAYTPYTVDVKWGTQKNKTLPAGVTLANYGQSGDGYLELSSDNKPYAPYLRVMTHEGEPWVTQTEHLRLGKLLGILGIDEGALDVDGLAVDTAEFGLAVGADLTDNTQPHAILSDTRMELFGVKQTWTALGPEGERVVRGYVNPDAGPNDYLFSLGSGSEIWAKGDGSVGISQSLFIGETGDLWFSEKGGTLLLGPYQSITPTSWTSSRGHIATIAGAFRWEAGLWSGTRALQIIDANTNICANPRFNVNCTDWWDAATNGVAASVATRPRWGTKCCLLTATAATPWIDKDIAVVNPVQGTDYTFSAYVRTDSPASIGKTAYVKIAETGGAEANASSDATVVLTSEWQRVAVSRTVAEADRTALRVSIVGQLDDIAEYFYIDGACLTATDYPTPYIDGSLEGCTWLVADDSTTSSVITATTVTLDSYVDVLNDKDELTIWAWVQAPWDWDEGGEANLKLMDSANSADASPEYTNRFSISYSALNNQLQVYCQTAGVIMLADFLTFKAGDWLSLGVALNFATGQVRLCVNGEVKASRVVPGIATLNVDQWKLGGHYSAGANPNGMKIGEFAVFQSELSAEDIASLHNRNAPLVDSVGASGPGLYILDGSFVLSDTATGARWVMDADGLQHYESGGTLGGKWDASGVTMISGTADINKFKWETSGAVRIAELWASDSTGDGLGTFTVYGGAETTSLAMFTDEDGAANSYAAFTVHSSEIARVMSDRFRVAGFLSITDGVAAPATTAGYAHLYVDTADGDLKVKFGDGTTKTLTTD